MAGRRFARPRIPRTASVRLRCQTLSPIHSSGRAHNVNKQRKSQ
nr:MAG TPA: hypothetical protein [Caudoviricetes sp.]